MPRVNLSLKLSSLAAQFEPLAERATTRQVLGRLLPILRRAKSIGAFVNVDMEQYATRDMTQNIFQTALQTAEFSNWSHAGIVVQAYLKDSLADLERLRDWAKAAGRPITIRLVKGAYWDYEVIHAQQNGWPIPVFSRKWETDASFERAARLLAQSFPHLRPAFGSHNLRSLAAALTAVEAAGLPNGAAEVQALHGMGTPVARALERQGQRVRVYMPYGAMLPGMAYLVRRLLENTSNESFLKVSSSGSARIDELLRDPNETGRIQAVRKTADLPQPNGAAMSQSRALPPFENEPPIDFSRVAARASFEHAIGRVAKQLPLECPILIGELRPITGQALESRDPSDASRLIARSGRATLDDVEAAVKSAHAAHLEWARVSPQERALVLIRAASIMRAQRDELAAWEVFECAKPWREADGDVCEAIDFCEYYAREMMRLAAPGGRDVPGETNDRDFLPRGVVAVIPPWNFPLAIPMGMVAAAIVAGNAVVLKPAEQSPAMAWHLVRILHEAGVPRAALNYLPGVGEEIGPRLVEHPLVAMIAFTGSRAVGLEINQRAAATSASQMMVKRVIAEMGGKNAIIVDNDADLDEAVLGVLHSAFGYAGQKCSACSRLIILEGVYDHLLSRLVEAAKTLAIGPATDPETDVPAVIDPDARARVERYAQIAAREGRVVLQVDPGPIAAQGNFVGPLIVADLDPKSKVAQEEIFGPVLAVLRARDLDHALEIALDVPYALTGGFYSRSPANIARVRREFLVGNLYINRAITGALVERQPFGGFKLSGIGTKAGGPDYLREFMLPRTVTENTMRRGFAPEVEMAASAQA
jgi:RHH-type proline utilization regulon transcriptional repressor/proline dehydrogenase/delta 1-pyrroline-5-carboxylate dehydrogenase